MPKGFAPARRSPRPGAWPERSSGARARAREAGWRRRGS